MGLIGMARGARHRIRAAQHPGQRRLARQHRHPPRQPGVVRPAAERRRHPLGRQGHVDEIAATCLFLVSDDSGFITGQTIHVNGGAQLPLTPQVP